MKRKQLMAITLAAVTAMAPATAFAEESTEAATEAVTEAAETEAATEAAEGETEVASEAAEGETEAAAAAEAADGDVAPIEGADVASRSSDAAPEWQEYNNLIQQIKTTTDLAEREAMMHQAEDMLMETGAVVPLYNYTDIYMQKSNVEGMYWNTFGYKYFMYCTKTAA